MHVAANAGNNGGGIGGMLDGMATEQGFYATVAYQRLLDGRSFIYDMYDIELTPGKKVETSQNGGTDETKKQEETEKKNNNKKDHKTDHKKKDDKKNKKSKKETEKRIRRVKRSRQALQMPQKTVRQTKTLPSVKKTSTSTEKARRQSKKKKATTKRKKNKKESEDSGWSFDGEDYVPELTADGKAEAETVTQSAENDPKTQVRTMAPAVLSGARLVIVLEALAFGIYRKKKGRRLR